MSISEQHPEKYEVMKDECEHLLKEAGAEWRDEFQAWDFALGMIRLNVAWSGVRWEYNGGAGGLAEGYWSDPDDCREWISENGEA